MFSPRSAMKYTPICASLMSLTQRGARKMATTPAASASAVATPRAVASLDTAHHRPPQEPRRPDEQHGQDDEERDREPQPVELEVQVSVVGHDEIEQHTQREPADDCPDGALEPAEHRRRERIDEDRPHHVRVERRRGGRGEEPGHGPDRRREPPAEREHPPHAYADEPAGG